MKKYVKCSESDTGYYRVGYYKNGVYQNILVKADNTEEALSQFQRSKGIKPNGCSPVTERELEIALNMKHMPVLSNVDVEEDDAAYEQFKYDMKNNDAYKELKSVLYKYGYNVGSAYIDDGQLEIVIQPVESMHPSIYQERHTKGEFSFTIQTTSYGALDIDEYKDFIKGANDAYECLMFLESWTRYDELYQI